MGEDERRQLWAQFASAAVAGFDTDDDEFTASDVAAYGADVADELLDEYDKRFGERERPRRRRRERDERPE